MHTFRQRQQALARQEHKTRKHKTRRTLTLAVTHIPMLALTEANTEKIAHLDALADEYMRVCQWYTTHFCTVAEPDAYTTLLIASSLSDKWHRCAIRRAA